MKTRRILALTAVLLAGAAGAALADEGGVFLAGEAQAGVRYHDQLDALNRVGEYLDPGVIEDVQPTFDLTLQGGTPTTLFNILLLYRDQETRTFAFGSRFDDYLTVDFDHGTFVHNLDHDLMQNLQAREALPDGSGGWRPGGKMVFHEDHDPRGTYQIAYERFGSDTEVALPFIPNGKVYSRYHEQRREGWKQAMTISHCAYCHVESDARRVDDEIKTWRAGLEGAVGNLVFNYEYGATDYTDRTQAPTRQYDPALHPVFGDTDPVTGTPYGVEFPSRLAWQDVTLPYSRGTDSEKRSHFAGLKLDVGEKHTARGSYTHTERRNWYSGVEGEFDAYVASWVAKPNAKTRLSARLLAYETQVDDVDVDLPDYRAGRPGGGQDFDWTRISAANREVLQADLKAGYRFLKDGWLSASWRHKEVDRDAMAQTQTTYVNDGVDNDTDTMIPSAAVAGKTTTDRFKLAASKRLGAKGNLRQTITYTTVDQPFMNPTGICEEGLNGEPHNLEDNGSVYYFQRRRYGNATSQPGQVLASSTRGSYQLSARSSVSGYLNIGTEKNDELNVYELERDRLAAGLNLWAAPTDRLMVTAGYFFSSVESNAQLCPPLFDG